MKKGMLILSWVLRILLALGFLLASFGKLTNNPQVIEMFMNWGYPNGFHFFIGIIELLLAVLVVIPRTLKMAIYGIAIILAGAMATHLIHDPPLETLRPAVFLIVLAGVYFINYGKKKIETEV